MPILTEEVEVKVNTSNIKYFEDLGYQIPMRKACDRFQKRGIEFVYDIGAPMTVKVKDLMKNSSASIDVLCDICKEKVLTTKYVNYNKAVETTGSYACRECSYIKTHQTTYDRLGYYYASQSPEVKEKINKTLCRYSNQKTSRQQLYLHSLYGGELNYPIKYYSADICFPEEKFEIEVDCGGHDLNVKTGRMTQEEFDKREIIRNDLIKKEGYKQMRIISIKDKLPSDIILLKMLKESREYFKKHPNHSWIEFNIDTSSLRNAECKNGIAYNFGDLRKIKESEISDISMKAKNRYKSTNKKGA